MTWAGTREFVDSFARAQVFSTTPGMNGWTIKDTSSSGAPTYLCITEDGGAAKLTLASTNEEEIVTLYFNDVLPFDLRKLFNAYWVAQVSGIDATTTLVMGVANAQNDTEDTVGVSAWFRLEGSASTSAIVVETDDATTNNDDKATGTTLAAAYKHLFIDFTQGLADVRFYVNQARVAKGTTFDMSAVAAGQNVQPFVQLHKSGGTGTPAVTLAEFGCSYKYSYG